MAACKWTPRRPTAIDEAAMTAGPVRNLTAIANMARDLPHGIRLGCKAINNPDIPTTFIHHKCTLNERIGIDKESF